MLGKRLGSMAMLTYIAVGAAGVPVFANMQAGPMALITPTGGFILSFVFVAFVTGVIAERSRKPSAPIYTAASLFGLAANYGIGVTYMYIAMNTWLSLGITYSAAWAGMIPFLLKDTGLACLAAIFMVTLSRRMPSRWLSMQHQLPIER